MAQTATKQHKKDAADASGCASHGTFCWNELMTSDIEAARDFYKGLFGWTDVESGLGQKKIELNQEAEIVSLMGSITVDNQGRSNVHGHGTVALSDGSVRGGHWWEAHVSIIADVFVTEEEGAPEPPK